VITKEDFDLLCKLAEARRFNKPKYCLAHVVTVLNIIHDMQPIGRNYIKMLIGLGEGTLKTMLSRFKEMGLAITDKAAGVILTERGTKIVEDLKDVIKIREISLPYNGWENSTLISLRNGREVLKKITFLELRDEVVKQGSKGAMISYFENGEITFPPEKHWVSEAVKIINDKCKEISCEEEDLLIVIPQKDKLVAFKSALRVIQIILGKSCE
jgi:predicted transcriptional regulator